MHVFAVVVDSGSLYYVMDNFITCYTLQALYLAPEYYAAKRRGVRYLTYFCLGSIM